jgi:hypothetical protein
MLAIWPEDPNRTGALQIKATAGVGLANAGPLPPLADPQTVLNGIASGTQIMHKFPAHCDLINILSWTATGEISHFNVYRNNFSSLIGTTTSNYFEDHQRPLKTQETYLITAIDLHGQESTPMTIVVDPR